MKSSVAVVGTLTEAARGQRPAPPVIGSPDRSRSPEQCRARSRTRPRGGARRAEGRLRARTWIVIAGVFGTLTVWPLPAHAQITMDVTRNLMGASSAYQNGRTEEAKTLVDQAATAARTPSDWRAVAESYRALGDTERWSWALDRSTRSVGQPAWPGERDQWQWRR